LKQAQAGLRHAPGKGYWNVRGGLNVSGLHADRRAQPDIAISVKAKPLIETGPVEARPAPLAWPTAVA